MELLQQAFLAFFAATGIAVLLWNVLQILLLTKEKAIEKHVVLMPKEENISMLEQTVAELQKATVCGKRFDSIWIDGSALSEEMREQMRLLTQEKDCVRICISDTFWEHIT